MWDLPPRSPTAAADHVTRMKRKTSPDNPDFEHKRGRSLGNGGGSPPPAQNQVQCNIRANISIINILQTRFSCDRPYRHRV